MSASLTPDQVERLLRLEHPDPHSILGIHPQPDGVIVRAYRPEARDVSVLIEGAPPSRMNRLNGAGLFEVAMRDRRDAFAYRLQIQYGNGAVATLYDTYSFPPTLGETDIYLWNEGRHERAWEKLGAHVLEVNGVPGVAFAVWAPNARGVSVVGDFNGWDGRLHMMRALGSSGIWELFVPELHPGVKYKFEIRSWDGRLFLKADPFAFATEAPPATASVVHHSNYTFDDSAWLQERQGRDALRSPMSIYEVHLGSWRRVPEENDRPLSYREAAHQLAGYAHDMGFTHVELMPVMEHPFSGSWGYEVTGYFAPTARFGTPDDFRYFVDCLHQHGVGVLLDWVPAHFPTDDFSLGRFDGTALFEHLDERLGFHPEWNTYIFNFGRNEVRNFLLASALFWLDQYHADGLRFDAVASMLYLDYGRKEGQWIPNAFGGRENLDAVSFIKMLNQAAYGRYPGISTIAEESTSWAGVSRPTYVGGLGFGFKWDMGWMHDTLEYFSKDPIYRRYYHRDITFGFLYAWSENFILPLSHDEIVYGKRSMLSKMPGDRWQRFANLRALYAYMWARPGKKMIFMGDEFGQWNEWNHDQSLDWHLARYGEHRQLQDLIRTLNRLYRENPALWEADTEPAGFRWIDADNADANSVAFMRIAPQSGRRLLCACNFSPIIREQYRIGVPAGGLYREILNTDSAIFGGSNIGNAGAVMAEAVPSHGFPFSLSLRLPPLGVLWFSFPDNS